MVNQNLKALRVWTPKSIIDARHASCFIWYGGQVMKAQMKKPHGSSQPRLTMLLSSFKTFTSPIQLSLDPYLPFEFHHLCLKDFSLAQKKKKKKKIKTFILETIQHFFEPLAHPIYFFRAHPFLPVKNFPITVHTSGSSHQSH